MLVCETCFLEYAGFLTIAGNFEEVKALPLEMDTDCICAFKLPAVRACSEGMLPKYYERWHELVNEMIMELPCTMGAIADADWYVLPDPDDPNVEVQEFDVCVACYTGHFKATGFECVLRHKKYPAGTERICDFSPVAARSGQYLREWQRSKFVGETTVFAKFVKRISLLALCPQSSSVKDRTGLD
ncbi:hypothetical protein CERZMDRAFT_99821 [Cercospora zeae-maydis SCOH1-5]|uniref:Uncharacterized protein n=1 Tax=Cercospora zeae-maydis SCOH1-5 TaxID=717836 RepID=A0A6A6F9Q0_9PEZI|nr:hypothetical protein CERZMDRAFT_99821 [Cercospora zeae-maydis SCOH1-5]